MSLRESKLSNHKTMVVDGDSQSSSPSSRRSRAETGSLESASSRTAAPTSPLAAETDFCYRVHFSCENLGRYFVKSKRRLVWRVVLTGRAPSERRDEHTVELVWSVKSGKFRLYWNGSNISHLFSSQNPSERVEFSWYTQTAEHLQVIAHAEELEGVNQYDLLINGKSFLSCPTVDKLPMTSSSKIAVPSVESEAGHEYELHEALSDLGSGDYFGLPGDDADFRLSMVGLNANVETSCGVVDELHSELYSPMLESLREQISKFLPQLEDMVSRAIINAFFVDSDSHNTSDLRSSAAASLTPTDPDKVEVSALAATHKWFVESQGSVDDNEEARLAFMQNQIDTIFYRVRSDELAPEQASRILLSVAAVLRLKFSQPLPRDTVLFAGLHPKTTDEQLHSALHDYGAVSGAAVSAKHPGYGFCRFEDAASVITLQQASRHRMFVVVGEKPTSIALFGSLHEDLSEQQSCGSEEKKIEDEVDLDACSNPISPYSTIPHLMAPLDAGYDSPGELMFTLSPDICAPSLKPERPQSDRTCSTTSATDYSSDCDGPMTSPNSVADILDHCTLARRSSPTLPGFP